jgi:hypothetical protein
VALSVVEIHGTPPSLLADDHRLCSDRASKI